MKAERTDLGPNTRFVVTNLDLDDDPQGLYERMYCARGEMENRINDQQLGLFAHRASSSDFHANQLRLLPAAWPTLSSRGCAAWPCRRPTSPGRRQTIRLRLLKLGPVALSNTRGVRLLTSRSHPAKDLFRRVPAASPRSPPDNSCNGSSSRFATAPPMSS